jgi:hypothetical protein
MYLSEGLTGFKSQTQNAKKNGKTVSQKVLYK